VIPQLVRQPAIAEWPRPPQFQPYQPHLDAVHRSGRQLAVGGEQAQIGELLLLFVEDRQRLAPRRLLLIVDLTQIQHRALTRPAARDAPFLNDAEVATALTVLLAVSSAEKQAPRRTPDFRSTRKVFTVRVSPISPYCFQSVADPERPQKTNTGRQLRKSG
jgi:hypothetical protein